MCVDSCLFCFANNKTKYSIHLQAHLYNIYSVCVSLFLIGGAGITFMQKCDEKIHCLLSIGQHLIVVRSIIPFILLFRLLHSLIFGMAQCNKVATNCCQQLCRFVIDRDCGKFVCLTWNTSPVRSNVDQHRWSKNNAWKLTNFSNDKRSNKSGQRTSLSIVL